MAVEVEEQDVVAVPVAERRGGAQPARVVHEPAVEEDHPRAPPVGRGVGRARHLLPRQQKPKSRVFVGGGLGRRARRARIARTHPEFVTRRDGPIDTVDSEGARARERGGAPPRATKSRGPARGMW